MSKNLDLSILDLALSGTTPSVATEVREQDKKLVLTMVALGEPTDAVARKLGVRLPFIDSLVKSDEGVNEIIRLQSALFPDPQLRIKKLANLALDVKLRLMLTAKSEVVRNSASTDILDRAGGKAVQRTQEVNSFDDLTPEALDRTIAKQNEKLDKLKATEARIRAARPIEITPASR